MHDHATGKLTWSFLWSKAYYPARSCRIEHGPCGICKPQEPVTIPVQELHLVSVLDLDNTCSFQKGYRRTAGWTDCQPSARWRNQLRSLLTRSNQTWLNCISLYDVNPVRPFGQHDRATRRSARCPIGRQNADPAFGDPIGNGGD